MKQSEFVKRMAPEVLDDAATTKQIDTLRLKVMRLEDECDNLKLENSNLRAALKESP